MEEKRELFEDDKILWLNYVGRLTTEDFLLRYWMQEKYTKL